MAVRAVPATGAHTWVSAGPGRAVVALAARQLRMGWLILAAVAAGMSAVVVVTYRATAQEALDAAALTALAESPAIRALFGEPIALDTVGGFTVWRTGTPLAVLVSAWSLLAATRLTRGDEEAGRWDLLAGGRLSTGQLVLCQTVVVALAAGGIGLAVSATLVLAGTPAPGAAVHGAGLGLTGAFFAGVGGLAAQVFPARAAATGAAAGMLGLGLTLRIAGDGVPAVSGLHWLSPFGLLALSRAYADDRLLPVAVLAAGGAVAVALAAGAAGRRDLRGGLLGRPASRDLRRALLGSVPAFAVRRLWRTGCGWAAGVSAYYLLVGALAVSLVDFLADNPRFAELAAGAGFPRLGTVPGYAASLLTLLAIPAGVFPAARLATLATDETERRLDLLLAGPVTRLWLLGAELAVTAAAAVALLLIAGVATWAGAAAAGAGLGLGAAASGALNVLPVALLGLGAAALALGWTPRAVLAVGSLPAVGGFLLHVVAETAAAPGWVGWMSPFAHLAPVPGTDVDWTGAVAMTAVAALGAAIGLAGYRRRDLRR